MSAVRRIAVVVAAYLCSVLGLLAALPLLFGAASLVPGAPGAWTLAGVAPFLFAGAPVVAVFVAVTAIVLSALPTLLIVGLAEIFAWRRAAVYVVPAAVVSAGAWWTLSPRLWTGLDPIGAAELALFAAAGAVAGAIYWGIAGRRAGTWRGEGA
ncbi:MAG: hypothetical protein U1E23_18145 [Reyranellaceae bacterium]